MRYPASEKLEIIRLVEQSHLSARQTLDKLGIPRPTFYRWYDRFLTYGVEGLEDRTSAPSRVWNRIPDDVRDRIITMALEHADLSPRELAVKFTDTESYFVSEASVYRLLKAHDLITSPAYIVIKANDEFKDKTVRLNEMWQTDFTYLKVIGWGWFYLSTILDDFSRYIIAWKLCTSMKVDDVTDTLDLALAASGCDKVKVEHRPRLLSDNGPCYVASDLGEWLDKYKIDQVHGAPGHPQTQGASYSLLGEDVRMTRHHLDQVLPDRAFAIFAYDHHTVWANTRALELGGLLHGAEIGAGAEIVMGEDGMATGELREMEAFSPLLSVTGFERYRLGLSTGGEPDPYPVGEEFEKDVAAMRRGLQYCVSHGFTSLLLMDGNLHQLQVLDEIRRRDGFLPARVRVPFHYKNFMTLDALEKASMMAATYKDDELSSGTVKLFYDGVLENWTARMVEPYGNNPETTGDSLFTPEEFAKVAVEADRRGLQIAVHSIGDGAVRAVLDGYAAAQQKNGACGSRHRIEHIEVVHPDDIARFNTLGVIASMQPPHPPGAMGLPLEPTLSAIGRARWPYAYAWRTLKEAGAHIPFASDWPVSPICPIRGMKAAVTRRTWADDLPDQSFTLQEAIAAYTVEGAYAEFKEDRKGRINPGFHADLTIFSDNLEAMDPEILDTASVKWTITGGRVVFAAVPN